MSDDGTYYTSNCRGGFLWRSPPPTTTVEPQPCNKTYASFEYGTGVEYGAAVDCPEILEIDTPARDLILIRLTQEAVVNKTYLSVDNYTFTDINGREFRVRQVLQPVERLAFTEILLVVDKHVAGLEYTMTIGQLQSRKGRLTDPLTGNFFARDAKADAMLSVTPNHYNSDPQTATLRHIIQALAQSDDLIGGL